MASRSRLVVGVLMVGVLIGCAVGGWYLYGNKPKSLEERLKVSPTEKLTTEDKSFAAIAQRKYGERRFWLVLAKANPGMSELRPGLNVRIPDKDLAEALLKRVQELRGIAMVSSQAKTAEGFPFKPTQERWVADSLAVLSPDKRFTLCDVRGFESPGRNWTLTVISRATGKALGKWGMDDGDFEQVVALWRQDSKRFIARVHTGYDEVMGEGPGTKYAYVLGSIAEDACKAEATVIDSNVELTQENMTDALKMGVEEVKKLLRQS